MYATRMPYNIWQRVVKIVPIALSAFTKDSMQLSMVGKLNFKSSDCSPIVNVLRCQSTTESEATLDSV